MTKGVIAGNSMLFVRRQQNILKKKKEETDYECEKNCFNRFNGCVCFDNHGYCSHGPGRQLSTIMAMEFDRIKKDGNIEIKEETTITERKK